MKRKILGNLGEEIASEYLKNKGYKIICKNYRTRFGEIDLISEKDNEIIFIEVRTKSSSNLLLPEESITKKKIYNYKKLALEYLLSTQKKYKNIKFDFIGIEYKSENNFKINHIKNFID
ncbi:MAG: YraN family protein [Caldisericia bacterium]|nr:YraN family protein [Caldisericia bacterium]